MKADWIVTPYFFETPDPGLMQAVPAGVACTVNDAGHVRDRSADALAMLHRPLADHVHAVAARGDLPVSIAGDCCASLPVMAGLQRAGLSPALVWLDAHGDFNTPETSPSGFLGGMPLAMMVGRGPQEITRHLGLRPVAETAVTLVGARDLDPLEAEALSASDLRRMSLASFSDLRIDRPVHLHFDNDVIDAQDVPANNYPVADGPPLDAVIAACQAFAAGNRLCAISLSGWNSRLDGAAQTARACQRVLAALLEHTP